VIYCLQLATESSLAEVGASLLRVLLAHVCREEGAAGLRPVPGRAGSRGRSRRATASKQRAEFPAVSCREVWMLRSPRIICTVGGWASLGRRSVKGVELGCTGAFGSIYSLVSSGPLI